MKKAQCPACSSYSLYKTSDKDFSISRTTGKRICCMCAAEETIDHILSKVRTKLDTEDDSHGK